MNILILGGTSFVGPSIAKLLKEEGNFVALFTRGKHPNDRAKDIPRYTGDIKNDADLKKLAKEKKWDVAIHQLAYDRGDVQRVLDNFQGLKRLILTSTIATYRFVNAPPTQPFHESQVDYDIKPIEENASDPHWKYARGKLEAERAVVEQKKIPYTILRHSFIYGPYDSHERSIWYAHRLQHHHPIFLPDHGTSSIRLLYALDAARAFQLALHSSKAENQTFNVAQEEIVPFREWILTLSHALKCAPDLHSIPSDMIPETWAGPLGYARNWIMSIDKIKSILGFLPTPFQKGVEETAKWFTDLPKMPTPYPVADIAAQRSFLTEWDHLRKKLKHD